MKKQYEATDQKHTLGSKEWLKKAPKPRVTQHKASIEEHSVSHWQTQSPAVAGDERLSTAMEAPECARQCRRAPLGVLRNSRDHGEEIGTTW
jgi:hypothetical protein